MPIDRDRHRARLLRFTRRAHAMLPPRPARRVLDLGCGRGVPTAELALLAGGEVVGVDRDLEALRALRRRAAERGVGARVHAVCGDLGALPFRPSSFDLLWAEGSVDAVDLAAGLRRWRGLLGPGGWLVVHGRAAGRDRTLAQAARQGFELVGSVDVPGQAWWADCYVPLLAAAEAAAASGDAAAVAELRSVRREAGPAATAAARLSSVFLVMRRAPGGAAEEGER